jgi:hypothetical protein
MVRLKKLSSLTASAARAGSGKSSRIPAIRDQVSSFSAGKWDVCARISPITLQARPVSTPPAR